MHRRHLRRDHCKFVPHLLGEAMLSGVLGQGRFGGGPAGLSSLALFGRRLCRLGFGFLILLPRGYGLPNGPDAHRVKTYQTLITLVVQSHKPRQSHNVGLALGQADLLRVGGPEPIGCRLVRRIRIHCFNAVCRLLRTLRIR